MKCDGCDTVTASQFHCGACHQTFGGLRAFDRHRVGHVNNRRCLAPQDLGLEHRHGAWRQPMTPEARQRFEEGSSSAHPSN